MAEVFSRFSELIHNRVTIVIIGGSVENDFESSIQN
jgi:hypothetical protein